MHVPVSTVEVFGLVESQDRGRAPDGVNKAPGGDADKIEQRKDLGLPPPPFRIPPTPTKNLPSVEATQTRLPVEQTLREVEEVSPGESEPCFPPWAGDPRVYRSAPATGSVAPPLGNATSTEPDGQEDADRRRAAAAARSSQAELRRVLLSLQSQEAAHFQLRFAAPAELLSPLSSPPLPKHTTEHVQNSAHALRKTVKPTPSFCPELNSSKPHAEKGRGHSSKGSGGAG
uniref:Uncharacterized protein n=1 Tax=Sphaerodactylus townsendi TaxID=933632 RepID=A0ACB8FD80_9SAUR